MVVIFIENHNHLLKPELCLFTTGLEKNSKTAFYQSSVSVKTFETETLSKSREESDT